MDQTHSIGIIFTDLLPVQNGTDHFAELESKLLELPAVKAVWYVPEIPLFNAELLSLSFKKERITKVILVGEHSALVKTPVLNAMLMAGNNPDELSLLGYREHGINDYKRLSGFFYRYLDHHLINNGRGYPLKQTNTLVIGGGIAGIQAALEIANGGQMVYLVEKSPTIGGHMAMFDKTFPTLDCAACILTPKMVDVSQHEHIDLLTYSEVIGISGTPGDYIVRILKKARRVNLSTCIGCGTCAEKCPVKVPSEFDQQTGYRKAIYIPFPQAVPNKYVIDEEQCLYVQKGKCGVCAKVCPAENCINFEDKDETIEIHVGNIIVATGFQTFKAERIPQFGYGKYMNVITSLELERLVNASGPTGGNITLPQKDKKGKRIFLAEGKTPQSVAFIHCVGSRDEHYNKYCSRVCCMYSLKLAHLVKEKLPDASVSEYYIDMRAFGKGYEEFYERIKNEGVRVIRGRTAKVDDRGGQLLIRGEDILHSKLIENEVDMVVLAVGLEANKGSGELAKMLGIQIDENGWFQESDYISDSVQTMEKGIYLAGTCQGPKDIPDSVAHAAAAAEKVLQNISAGQISLEMFTWSNIRQLVNT